MSFVTPTVPNHLTDHDVSVAVADSKVKTRFEASHEGSAQQASSHRRAAVDRGATYFGVLCSDPDEAALGAAGVTEGVAGDGAVVGAALAL